MASNQVKLAALEPTFVAYRGAHGLGDVDGEDPAKADGIMFLCPKCTAAKGGVAGVHSVLIWFRDRGIPDDAKPGPGRWAARGSSFSDLTLQPSINLTGAGCGWHGWITNGEAIL